MKLSRFQSYIGKAKRFWIIYLSYFSVSILFLLFCRFLLTHSSIHTFKHSHILIIFSRCKDTHYFRTCKTNSADGGKFREDNSTLTLGRDGKYYFCFILPEA